MNILIIGDETNFKECQQKFGQVHSYELKQNQREAEMLFLISPLTEILLK
jgi:hypothetical protein